MIGQGESFTPEKSQEDDSMYCGGPTDFDLELAAEIGKSLLERNRDLEYHLKRAQDYGDEQHCRAEFYANQIDLLRAENEVKGKLCEQLESQLQETTEKSVHNENDSKLLRVQNRRLMETVDLLEKRLETARAELKQMQSHFDDRLLLVNETSELVICNNDLADAVPVSPVTSPPCCQCNELEKKLLSVTDQVNYMEKAIIDMTSQHELDERQYVELETDLKAVLDENESLQQKIREIQAEVIEWQDIAEKAKHQSHIRHQLNDSYGNESDHVYVSVGTDVASKKSIYYNVSSQENTMTKSKSCEALSISSQIDHAACVPPPWTRKFGKLNLSWNGSVLDELDSHYGDLVERYEALLSKFKEDGKLQENPARSLCVQKAIQTMSSDFAETTQARSEGEGKVYPSVLSSSAEYRKKFAEIFSKLKEFSQS